MSAQILDNEDLLSLKKIKEKYDLENENLDLRKKILDCEMKMFMMSLYIKYKIDQNDKIDFDTGKIINISEIENERKLKE